MNNQLRYVLKHEIDNRQCKICYAMWFAFDHHGSICYYRLGADAPENCKICALVDKQVEEKALVTSERWNSIE